MPIGFLKAGPSEAHLRAPIGVAVQIDAATDVRFGQPVAMLQEGAAEDLGDGTERVTIRVNTTLSQTPLIFFRARVVAE